MLSTLIFALLVFVAALMLTLSRTGRHGVEYIVCGWLGIILTLPFLSATQPYSLELAISLIPRSMFPTLLLFGTLLLAGKPHHLWIVVTGLLLGIWRFVMTSKFNAELATLLITPFHAIAYIAAAVVLFRMNRNSERDPIAYLLAIGYLALALRESWAAVEGYVAGVGEQAFTWWASIAAIVAALQISRVIHNMQHRESALKLKVEDQSNHLDDLAVRLNVLISNTHDFILETSIDAKLYFVSDNVRHLLGYDPENFNTSLLDIIHPEDLPAVIDWSQNAELNEGILRPPVRIFDAAGEIHWIEATTRRFIKHAINKDPEVPQNTQEGELRVAIVGRDITKRVNTERALDEANERFRAFKENSLDILFEFDQSARTTYVSPNCINLFGYSPSELIGKTVTELFALVNASNYQSPTIESVYFYSEDIQFSPVPIGNIQSITTRSGEQRWIEISANSYKNGTDSVTGLATVRDVTERIKLQEQGNRGRILESLGLLAGGVAHDVNNLLSVIQGNLEIAQDDMSEQEARKFKSHLTPINAAIRSASDITTQLLIYSGQGSFAIGDVDLSSLMNELKPAISDLVQPEVELEFELDIELPAIRGDKSQIELLISNLVSNGNEAIDHDHGQIVIKTSRRQHRNTNCVVLEVQDNGEGMDEETRVQMFDPFFTTRFTGRGLGLATVYGIVEAHCAEIEIESSINVGTKVRIYFPCTPENTAQPASIEEIEKVQSIPSILIVDDESSIRMIMTEILLRSGYPSVAASTGSTAIEVIKACANDIEIAFIDLEMPDLSGRELAMSLTALAPDLVCVLMSGHRLDKGAQELEGYDFLQKPFSSAELIAKVAAIL